MTAMVQHKLKYGHNYIAGPVQVLGELGTGTSDEYARTIFKLLLCFIYYYPCLAIAVGIFALYFMQPTSPECISSLFLGDGYSSELLQNFLVALPSS